MRDGRHLLDDAARYCVGVGAGYERRADRRRAACRHALADPDAQDRFPDGVIACPADVSVKTLIRILAASGHPVLLTDGDRLVGVCGGQDVLKALDSGAPVG